MHRALFLIIWQDEKKKVKRRLINNPNLPTLPKPMSSKVKILLFGAIGDHVEDFLIKLNSLQNSKAGPFDGCFCVGPVSPSILTTNEKLPIPVFLHDCSRFETQEIKDGSNPFPPGIIQLAENLFGLQGMPEKNVANVWSIRLGQKDEVVVASVPNHVRLDSDGMKPLQEKLSHVSYVGCDLLLTGEPPQGIENLLAPDQEVQGSFDIADIALRARARYHIAPHVLFAQSRPFKHLASSSSTFTPRHCGRFILIAPVIDSQQAKQKGKLGKFVHALGMTPLNNMTTEELDQKPYDLQPNPFTDDWYEKETDRNAPSPAISGLSEAQARRLISDNNSQQEYRWNQNRQEMLHRETQSDAEVDDTIKTLFVHGLHKDVSGELQSHSSALHDAFRKYDVFHIRRPPTSSSYAFLEFDSHDAARKCLEDTQGRLSVGGVQLTLRWGSKSTSVGTCPPQKKRKLTESEAQNSSSLYFRVPSDLLSSDASTVAEQLRKLMEHILETALGDPEVSAANEPALQVQQRFLGEGTNYGFLDFASHAAASMALATLTGSTDGGPIQKEKDEAQTVVPGLLGGVVLHWAPERRAESLSMMETASGIKFERQHFPADARTDCWFCLASPTCEKHLITSVHNQCYITMPKGPIHKEGHVLIVPVAHSSQGAFADQEVCSEVDFLKEKLREHASEVYDMDLVVFERAIQTKGGYHTHVQCVPVPKTAALKLQATLLGMAKRCGFHLREINTEIGLASIADDGYFYAEIPNAEGDIKRFLYNAGGESRSVPIQFGREVLASVLDDPSFAHWKACVLNNEEETKLALKFRESFAKYEPREF